MIQLNHIQINDIPLIELVDEKYADKSTPLVVFFHGWTNVKESVLVNGYELAKRGIRALLPDAINHGERDPKGNGTDNQLIFWEVVKQNVKEFDILVNYFIENDLTSKDKIGVSGLSMGGITTSAILTQYDWVKTAVCLMGTPAPIPFTEWLLKANNFSDFSEEEMITREEYSHAMKLLEPLSLDRFPEKIAGRPVHFWHGTEDEVVPYEMSYKFVEENKSKTYGRNLTSTLEEGIAHKVPYNISVKMAEFLKNNL